MAALFESGLKPVGTTSDRSAFAAGQPIEAAGLAPAEQPLSPPANWHSQTSADLYTARFDAVKQTLNG